MCLNQSHRSDVEAKNITSVPAKLCRCLPLGKSCYGEVLIGSKKSGLRIEMKK